jgi:hypothetical protein
MLYRIETAVRVTKTPTTCIKGDLGDITSTNAITLATLAALAKGPAKPDPLTTGVFVMVHQYRLRGAPPDDAKALLERLRTSTAVVYVVDKLVEATDKSDGLFEARGMVVDVVSLRVRCEMALRYVVAYDPSRPKAFWGNLMTKLEADLFRYGLR